ncbi:MAG: hypothetical protein FWB91_08525 [Defluviitaleaceae bacterium]|nr:hypothetical protein [Defluviitaleaceae bacterium]
MELYRRFGNVLFAVSALLLMLGILFAGHNVGMSDQGDFVRVMNASSLSHRVHERAFIFVDSYVINLEDASFFSNLTRIMFSPEGVGSYPSIHILLVRVSVAMNLVLNFILGQPLDIYRIGILGAMTAALYAGLLFWLFCQIKLKNPFLDAAAKLFIIFIACDVGYIAYFNSFYSESVQILAFCMIIVAAMRIFRGKTGLWDFGLLVVAAVVYGWSKFVNLPIAILIILAFAIILGLAKKATWLKLGFVAFAGILTLLLVYAAIPDWMDIDTNFNSVFFGVVKDVDDATARTHLEFLGLNPEMARFASQNRYVAGVAQEFLDLSFEEEFLQLSKLDLLWFYIQHPGRLWDGIRMSISHSGLIRPWYIGNYYSERMVLTSRFSGWTWLRARLAFDTMLGNAALWLAFFAAALTFVKEKGKWPVLIVLAAVFGTGAYSAAISIIANGEADLAKHMFKYVQIMDMIFVVLIFYLISGMRRLRRFCAMTEPIFNGNVYKLAPVGAALCIVILFIPMGAIFVQWARPVRVTDLHGAKIGDVVSVGYFNGEPMRWLIVDENEHLQTLMAVENIVYRAFDESNSNFWVESGLREWLNGEFLREAFGAVAPVLSSRELILSVRSVEYAEYGDRDFYAFHVPAYAFRGRERAFRKIVYDYVRLPDGEVMERLMEMGRPVRGGYWLEIPRFLCGEMTRYVSRDGFILLQDAERTAGVRPVIEVERR